MTRDWGIFGFASTAILVWVASVVDVRADSSTASPPGIVQELEERKVSAFELGILKLNILVNTRAEREKDGFDFAVASAYYQEDSGQIMIFVVENVPTDAEVKADRCRALIWRIRDWFQVGKDGTSTLGRLSSTVGWNFTKYTAGISSNLDGFYQKIDAITWITASVMRRDGKAISNCRGPIYGTVITND